MTTVVLNSRLSVMTLDTIKLSFTSQVLCLQQSPTEEASA